jgi:predicted glycoside hydrolase/deacetylase ChbG (UPF0249 family)
MINEIIGEPDNWTKEAVDLAKELHSMKTSYAQYAANFSQKLYIYQDALGLEGEEIIKIQTDLAQIRQTINDCSDQMVKTVIVNQPAPHLGDLPKEDVENLG